MSRFNILNDYEIGAELRKRIGGAIVDWDFPDIVIDPISALKLCTKLKINLALDLRNGEWWLGSLGSFVWGPQLAREICLHILRELEGEIQTS